MDSLVNSIKNLFSSARVDDGCELQDLKCESKNTKELPALQPRAQHSASAKSFFTAIFQRGSFSLQIFSRESRVKMSVSSNVSKILDSLARAQENNNPKKMIASLKELQSQFPDLSGLDHALSRHLLMKSKHKGSCNPIQVVPHMRLLAEANPVKFQGSRHFPSDEKLNQFHAELMRRLEQQYEKAFKDK